MFPAPESVKPIPEPIGTMAVPPLPVAIKLLMVTFGSMVTKLLAPPSSRVSILLPVFTVTEFPEPPMSKL